MKWRSGKAGPLAGSVLIAGLSAACADEAPHDTGPVPTVTVEGMASRDVAPDMAVISIGVGTTRTTAQDAAQVNSRVAKAIVDAAKADGVAESDIATTEATLSPVTDAPKDGAAPHVRAFQAVNRLAIKVRKIDAAGTIVGHLLDQGANDLEGIAFTVADAEPLLDSVRSEAAQQARHQAEVYANALGAKLGRVLLVRPDAVSLPFRTLMKVAAPAPTPAGMPMALASGTQKLEARVNISWELQPAQP